MPLHRKKILIIDGSESYSFGMARSLSYCKDYEIHLLVLTTKKHLSKLRFVHCHTVESYEADDWMKAIESVVKKFNIDLTIAAGEKGIKFLIEHQASLSAITRLPVLPSRQSFDIASNKARLSEFISENDLSQPRTFLYKKGVDLAGLSQLEFPVLIKLPSGEDGKGIERFEDLTTLTEYLLAHDFDEDVLCQEFVRGHDICASVMCKDGEITAYTIQQCLIENPKSYSPSLAVEFVYNENVMNEASRIMKLLNWQGVAHIDMRLNESTGQVYVLEINPRFWESLMASLFAGVNFTWLYCQQMLNFPIEYYGFAQIQFMRLKTFFEWALGKHKLLSAWRPLSLRTGLTYHLHGLRRLFSIRS